MVLPFLCRRCFREAYPEGMRWYGKQERDRENASPGNRGLRRKEIRCKDGKYYSWRVTRCMDGRRTEGWISQ